MDNIFDITIKEIPASTYEAITSRHNKYNFTIPLRKNVYLWYKEYKDQTVNYKIVPSFLANHADIKEYARFGLLVGESSEMSEQGDRNYVLIIPGPELDRLESYVEDYITDNLPKGALPTHYFIEKEYNSYKELFEDDNKVRELLPYCEKLADYSDLLKSKNIAEFYKEELKVLDNLETFEVKDYIERIHNAHSDFNDKTIAVFKNVVSQILEKVNDKTILIYTGQYSELFCKFAAYMLYYHGVKSYIFENIRPIYKRYYSMIMFDRNRMLVENQLKYLTNIPTLLFTLSDYGLFFIINRGVEMSMTIKYVEVESIDSLPVTVGLGIDPRDLNIRPVNSIFDIDNDVYNLATSPMPGVESNHSRLLSLMVKFENKLGLKKSLCDVTNTFFFEKEESVYIAYIEKFDVTLNGLSVGLSKGIGTAEHKFNLDDISVLYPLELLFDYEVVMNTLSNLCQKLGITEITTAIPKITPNDGVLLEYFYTNGRSVTPEFEGMNFTTVGLWWRETYKVRVGLYKDLLEHLSLRNVRKESSYFSVFGGRHRALNTTLEVTENMLKGGSTVV